MDYNTLYWLDDVISYLGILVGVGGAIFLFTRRKTVPAILALIGFLSMALHPILDILLYRLIAYNSSSRGSASLDYAYVCIAGPGFFPRSRVNCYRIHPGFSRTETAATRR